MGPNNLVSTHEFIHAGDTWQIQTYEGGNIAVLDAEGDVFIELPSDPGVSVLHNIIFTCRRHYDAGVRFGKWQKAEEIRKALNVPEVPSAN